MRICAVSDTHNQLNKVDLPEADILIHCGDWTLGGSPQEIIKFNKHLGTIKHKYSHILATPGNHDHLAMSNEKLARQFITNATVLIDESRVIDGVKFYGSPWSNWFMDWSFGFPESDLDNGEIVATQKYAEIPDDVNVLITHGPPFNFGDKVERTSLKNRNKMHVGSTALAARIDKLKELKLYCTGHIHSGFCRVDTNETIFVNAAILNDNYVIQNKPWVIDI